MTTQSVRIDGPSRRVVASFGVLLVVAMAVLTASPARGETAPPVDVSFFDESVGNINGLPLSRVVGHLPGARHGPAYRP